jgi:hypothetical protein
MARPTMSMESAIDEERINVLALLEAQQSLKRGPTGGRASSPYTTGNNTRSAVRSMLDVGDEPAPRRGSSMGANGRVTIPVRGPYRSMLDIDSPPTPREVHSAQTSPTESTHKIRNTLSHTVHPRSFSDASSQLANFGPRALPERKLDPVSDYQFSGFLTNNPGASYAPKRNTLAGKKPLGNSIGDAMKGDLSAYGSKDHGRNHSIAATGIGIGTAGKSQSPHNRLGLRSSSPYSGVLSANSVNILNTPGNITLDSGAQVDMNSAYRRLSDANLALAGGSLAFLSTKGRKQRADSRDATSPERGRLEKDWHPEDESIVESSEEERSYSSDEEEGHRGRKKNGGAELVANGPESSTIGMGRVKGPRTALSLMAAAEEEREWRTLGTSLSMLMY